MEQEQIAHALKLLKSIDTNTDSLNYDIVAKLDTLIELMEKQFELSKQFLIRLEHIESNTSNLG